MTHGTPPRVFHYPKDSVAICHRSEECGVNKTKKKGCYEMNAVLFSKSRIGLAVTLAAGLCASVGLAETESPYATGGEVTKVDLGNCRVRYIHVFTNTDEAVTFKSTGLRDLSLRYLVVGGGGGGGCATKNTGSSAHSGGGGGGGGVCETNDVPFGVDGEWLVLVGRGAQKVESASKPGTVAGASSISNGTEEVVLVPGGGNGGRGSTSTNPKPFATAGAAGGGVGGPGSDAHVVREGTYPSSIFGVMYGPFAGGGYEENSYLGGGGGGAGAAGTAGVRYGNAGAGGEGLTSDITGEELVYGSGGGAGAQLTSRNTKSGNVGGKGGEGGKRAGDGATFEIRDSGATTNLFPATLPAANSGCGGGGGGTGVSDTDFATATDGADGIVVIRYEVAESPCEGGDVVTRTHVRGTRYTYIHIFTNTAAAAEFRNLTDCDLKLRYLVVGAGGAGAHGVGGAAGGAGGGGGGVIEARGYPFASGSRLSVEVGKGTGERSGSNLNPEPGASSFRNGETVVSAPGGGNAALYSNTSAYRLPATGGANGGGGGRGNVDGATGTFVSSLNGIEYGPFTGGDFYSGARVGGSGAGAGENGRTAPSKTNAGAGGEGLTSDITGEALVYGSGGGAGEGFFAATEAFPGCQGSDGGTRAGNGTKHDFTFTYNGDGSITTNFNYIAATKPAANSGCGGAGGGIGTKDSDFRTGTGGADGIVVFRYDYDPTPPGLMLIFR